jgi:filamentous hemagglutinin
MGIVDGAIKWKSIIATKGTSNTIFKNGNVTADTIGENLDWFRGKSADEIADALTSQGYEVTVRNSTRSSSGAQIIEIHNNGGGMNISQVQVSPGGGRHGSSPYIKISTTDQGIFKIVDGSASDYLSNAVEKATIFFTGGN